MSGHGGADSVATQLPVAEAGKYSRILRRLYVAIRDSHEGGRQRSYSPEVDSAMVEARAALTTATAGGRREYAALGDGTPYKVAEQTP